VGQSPRGKRPSYQTIKNRLARDREPSASPPTSISRLAMHFNPLNTVDPVQFANQIQGR
jgi:hypothetical protein